MKVRSYVFHTFVATALFNNNCAKTAPSALPAEQLLVYMTYTDEYIYMLIWFSTCCVSIFVNCKL